MYGYVGSNPLSFIDPFGFRGCPPSSSWGWDAVQGALDVAGLSPGAGILADLTNAGISYARGNYADASLSMAAAVPIVGNVAGLAKIAKSAKKIFKKVTKKLKRSPKFSKYEDVTERGSRWPNKETDVSMDDFVDSFMKAGYVPTLRGNGRVIELTKGNKKYTVRAFSSEGKPTAEVFVRGTRKMKIRLGQ